MGESKIEWTERVWNPITGCSKISPGCRHCYAERMANRLKGRYGYPQYDPFAVTIHMDRMREPFGIPGSRRIFVCSMGDLFHDDVPLSAILDVFEVMANCQRHTFMVLTKRPERALYLLAYPKDRLACESAEHHRLICTMPLANVWLGVTAENQEQADKRIPILLQIPAAVRFVSCEPLLEPVEIERYCRCSACGYSKADDQIHWDHHLCKAPTPRLDLVIAGCESGPRRRPAQLDWFRSLRDQCQAAGVPYFLKQAEIGGKVVKMPELDGKVWAEMPGGVR